jgi:hypothetical protein
VQDRDQWRIAPERAIERERTTDRATTDAAAADEPAADEAAADRANG